MPGRVAPRNADVFVEIPKSSQNKYELDETTGRIRFELAGRRGSRTAWALIKKGR